MAQPLARHRPPLEPPGLRVLRLPDPAQDGFSIHFTYLVTSGHEASDERGMAQR